MRPSRILVLLFVLTVLIGVSVAQDTNFPVGPQYLVTSGNPMLLRPIATPSMSLSGATSAGTSEVPSPVQFQPFAPVETVVYLGNVYWGEHKAEEVVARRVDTPSMAADQTSWYMNFVANQGLQASAPSTENLETSSGAAVIELSGGASSNVPASLMESGFLGASNLAPSNAEVPLGDVATYWKSHRNVSARIYTNADVVRRKG